MSTALAQFAQPFDFNSVQQVVVVNGVFSRLIAALDAMDKASERLPSPDRDAIGDLQRVSFTLVATRKQHERLYSRLAAEPSIQALFTFRDSEED